MKTTRECAKPLAKSPAMVVYDEIDRIGQDTRGWSERANPDLTPAQLHLIDEAAKAGARVMVAFLRQHGFLKEGI